MRHKHRILPGHVGGTYVEGNVVSVSVTQHTMWHFANWQLWGREEDRLAWRGLAGIVGKEEIIRGISSANGKANVVKIPKQVLVANGVKNGRNNVASLLAHANTQVGRAEGGKRTAERTSRPIVCVETGHTYSSCHEAFRKTGIRASNVNQSCNKGCRAGGFHWQFVN